MIAYLTIDEYRALFRPKRCRPTRVEVRAAIAAGTIPGRMLFGRLWVQIGGSAAADSGPDAGSASNPLLTLVKS